MIDAAYWQMYNSGQFYVPQLGGLPITIHEWKRRELARWDRLNLEQKGSPSGQGGS
jgi:hypothetical protein